MNNKTGVDSPALEPVGIGSSLPEQKKRPIRLHPGSFWNRCRKHGERAPIARMPDTFPQNRLNAERHTRPSTRRRFTLNAPPDTCHRIRMAKIFPVRLPGMMPMRERQQTSRQKEKPYQPPSPAGKHHQQRHNNQPRRNYPRHQRAQQRNRRIQTEIPAEGFPTYQNFFHTKKQT